MRAPSAYSGDQQLAPPLCEDDKAIMRHVVRTMSTSGPPGLEDAGAWYGYSARRSRRQVARGRAKINRIEMDMACAP